MANYDVKNVVTIGASAGGIRAVSDLAAGLKEDLDAAVFVVIHISRNSLVDIILQQIQKKTRLKCIIPSDGEEIRNNVIYLAPADRHMMLEKGRVIIQKGAYDNHWRPSIDVLFRSAAAAYDSCVTGIILTGLLDDGTSGMSAIKRSGGLCIIQDPQEAEFPDMPENVIKNVQVDFKVPVNEIGYILSDLHSRGVCDVSNVPEDVRLEADITRRLSTEMIDQARLGDLTPLTCPDCGGVLVKVKSDTVPRYRCYTGHSFTERSLEDEQVKGLEESIWIAIRMMEERKNLLTNMTVYNSGGRDERVFQLEKHIDRLKKMLLELGTDRIEPK